MNLRICQNTQNGNRLDSVGTLEEQKSDNQGTDNPDVEPRAHMEYGKVNLWVDSSTIVL